MESSTLSSRVLLSVAHNVCVFRSIHRNMAPQSPSLKRSSEDTASELSSNKKQAIDTNIATGPSTAESTTEQQVTKASADDKAYGYEKEAKLLGVSPLEFTDKIVNAITDYVADGVDELEGFLKSKAWLATKQREVEQSCDRWMEAMMRHVDVNVDKFELYVANHLLRLPNDVQVDDEEGMDDDGQDESTQAEAELLSAEILQATKTHAKLRAQRSLIHSQSRAADRALSHLGSIAESVDDSDEAKVAMTELRNNRAKLKDLMDGIQSRARQTIATSGATNLSGVTGINAATKMVGGETGVAARVNASLRQV